jgi:hypothetical protein
MYRLNENDRLNIIGVATGDSDELTPLQLEVLYQYFKNTNQIPCEVLNGACDNITWVYEKINELAMNGELERELRTDGHLFEV